MSSKAAKDAKAKERADRAAVLLAEAEQKRKKENLRRGAIVGLVLAAVVAAAIVITRINRTEVIPPEIAASQYGLVVGQEGAPREVVIYEDFLCPICGDLEAAGGEGLAAAAAAGTVVVDYRPIGILSRFGPYSEASLNAFFVVRDVAGDEVAKEFHDLLYDDQPSEEGPFPDADWLVDKAVEAGADEAAVRPDIESGARMDDVEAATAEAEAAGVEGTPTVFLDGAVFDDGKSWDEIATNLVDEVS